MRTTRKRRKKYLYRNAFLRAVDLQLTPPPPPLGQQDPFVLLEVNEGEIVVLIPERKRKMNLLGMMKKIHILGNNQNRLENDRLCQVGERCVQPRNAELKIGRKIFHPALTTRMAVEANSRMRNPLFQIPMNWIVILMWMMRKNQSSGIDQKRVDKKRKPIRAFVDHLVEQAEIKRRLMHMTKTMNQTTRLREVMTFHIQGLPPNDHVQNRQTKRLLR
mmetsp:Transcript_23833/g.43057  ORF Transcript_23833/g.43057 Transcript_23833/m.43057 type:complete len:218 (-) Transcript_23833:2058-2711(-)